jgi:hypothetical protein
VRSAPELMIERRDHADMTASTHANEPTESTDAAEPIDPMDNTEPIEPTDRNDPRLPMHSTESSDQSDHFEGFRAAIARSRYLARSTAAR